MAPRAGKVGAVYLSDMTTTSSAWKEATTNLDPGVYLKYRVTDLHKRYFPISQGYTYTELETVSIFANYTFFETLFYQELKDVCVFVDGVVQLSGYAINYPEGIATFSSPLLIGNTVTISAKYYPVVQVLGFFNWTINPIFELADSTEFGGDWRSFVGILHSVNGEASKFFYSDDDMLSRLTTGESAIVVLYVDVGNNLRYEGRAFFTDISTETPVDTLIRQAISFQGHGEWFYRNS